MTEAQTTSGPANRTPPGAIYAIVAPVALLTLCGALALAPASDLASWGVWLALASGAAVLCLALAALALLLSAAARLGGSRRPATREVALAIITIVVGLASLRAIAPLRLADAGSARVGVLAGLLLLSHLVFRLAARRLGVDPGEGLAFLIAILAAPVLAGAASETRELAGAGMPWLAVALAVYAAGLGWAFLSGGRQAARRHPRLPRPGTLAALGVAAALAALRLATTNPHALHLTPATAAVPVEVAGIPAAGLAEVAGTPAPAPPVLLVVLDACRRDALDLRDPAVSATPSLAAFATAADVYPRAIANASWTLPGHASIFSGLPLHAHRTDVTSEPGFRPRLPEQVPTIQKILAARGYRTSCITANGIVSLRTGLASGFGRYRHPGRDWLFETLPYQALQLVGIGTPLLSQLVVDVFGVNQNATAEEMVDLALSELDGGPHPLYLFLNFMDVHRPFPAPPGTPLGERLAYWRDLPRLLDGERPRNERDWEVVAAAKQWYDAQAQRMDHELGRLFRELEARGWLERMLIVVTADHGEAFWENPDLQGYAGHHGAYEPVVRIPLLVKRPGQRLGRIVEAPAQQSDMLPLIVTFAAEQGIEAAGSGLGADREVITEWYPRQGGREGLLPWSRVALYRGHYKYLLTPGGEALLDLAASPWEGADVLARRPQLAAGLRGRLRDLLAAGGGTAATALDPVLGPSPGVDPQLREELRALGYTE